MGAALLDHLYLIRNSGVLCLNGVQDRVSTVLAFPYKGAVVSRTLRRHLRIVMRAIRVMRGTELHRLIGTGLQRGLASLLRHSHTTKRNSRRITGLSRTDAPFNSVQRSNRLNRVLIHSALIRRRLHLSTNRLTALLGRNINGRHRRSFIKATVCRTIPILNSPYNRFRRNLLVCKIITFIDSWVRHSVRTYASGVRKVVSRSRPRSSGGRVVDMAG